MNIFIKYLITYIREHFNLKLYLAFALFTGALIWLNYHFDFEDSIIDSYYGSYWRMVFFFLLHAFGYYSVLFITVWITGRKELIRNWGFWLKSSLGFLILAFDRNFYYHREISTWLFEQDFRYVRRVIGNMNSLASLVLPLFMMYLIYDRKSKFGFYGLRIKNVYFKPYFMMFLVIIPLTFSASFLPEFIDYYPVYKRSAGEIITATMQWPDWLTRTIFEIFYLLDFISVELFFRGFLVIGLVRFLGKDAVLPMVCTYVILHFGKPVGETISSVFGGYILGVFAYYSRNIWGGVFVHVGVALTMEMFAFMQMGFK